MVSSPHALVLTGFGINAEDELAQALQLGGAKTEYVHFNKLLADGGASLEKYQLLALPGGFSFGDDIQAGRVLANKFRYKLHEPLKKFIDAGKPVLGICNGFQVLVQLGALPGFENWERRMTLMRNASGRFENRWVHLRAGDSVCQFTAGLGVLSMPVRHGEGRVLFASGEDQKKMEENKQIVFRYADGAGNAADSYPANPNGSADAVAGVCNRTGNVLGLMPHPECHIRYVQSPLWTQNPPERHKKPAGFWEQLAVGLGLASAPAPPKDEGNCQALFANLAEYARKF